MPRTLTLRPSAKINLLLRVGPRQDSGYHDVCTILQSIGLSDTLTFTTRSGPFALATRAPGVAADRSNLVWRAAAALWRAAGRAGDPRDVHIKLQKAIPVGAGLGGGSADAAATLAGLNAIWDAGLSPEALAGLGAELGADVPFFFVGGTAMGIGRGDEVYPLEDAGKLGILVVQPAFGVSTADAYGWLDADRGQGLASPGSAPASVSLGWASGPVRLANDLEPPVSRRHPAIREAIEACLRAGARVAAMSGSGSAVFGVFSPSVVSKAARAVRRSGWLVLPTHTLARREARRRIGL